jgi:hypothetical protein
MTSSTMTKCLLIYTLLCSSCSALMNGPLRPRPLHQSRVERRDFVKSGIGAIAALSLSAPSLAAVKIDPSQVQTTKNGVKYVTVKEGACPAADFTGGSHHAHFRLDERP